MSAMLVAEVEAQRCDAVHVSDLVRAQRRLDWLGAMRRGPQELARIQTEFVRRLGGRGSKGGRGRGGPFAARVAVLGVVHVRSMCMCMWCCNCNCKTAGV